jgi:chromosome segregation ATPase
MSDDIEHRIEEVIDELRDKTMYWKRLGYRAIDEIKRLRVSEAALLVQLDGLKDALAQAEDTIEELRTAEPEDWFG